MSETVELPESWRPTEPPPPPEPPVLPVCDVTDPAQLAAWYGPFGWADHLRKIMLDSCAEMVRAEAQNKLTESRIDQLAHTHLLYKEWIVANLEGRIAYQREVLKGGFGS